ncbi:hypothetical protein KUTeg_000718, partial [Tegillarca granosa]
NSSNTKRKWPRNTILNFQHGVITQKAAKIIYQIEDTDYYGVYTVIIIGIHDTCLLAFTKGTIPLIKIDASLDLVITPFCIIRYFARYRLGLSSTGRLFVMKS